MTNAEKLAKDIEQLSDIINGIISSCDYCIYRNDDPCVSEASHNRVCFEGVEKWLKEEAKD